MQRLGDTRFVGLPEAGTLGRASCSQTEESPGIERACRKKAQLLQKRRVV
ncbi:Hypothetical predicted protein [Podarcis lilfordi]|uniref:Uncharacterized protein n=1 Tax=Podarcis lilfordi TaxID=74358 RepID=A0AA35KU14_9SAUR|nr:Hypothetical predicted protein [Podarcis lilfordi]